MASPMAAPFVQPSFSTVGIRGQEVFKQSDFVICSLPGGEATYHACGVTQLENPRGKGGDRKVGKVHGDRADRTLNTGYSGRTLSLILAGDGVLVIIYIAA